MTTKAANKFSKLNLSKETLQAIEAMKYQSMTPIQEAAIPAMIKGQDIIGQADTGTGKTAAFSIPVIESLNPNSHEIQALVVCPTRELCCQVAKQVNDLMKFHKNYKCVPVYGGQRIEIQLKAFKNKPQVIIGTPGRLIDHIKRGSLKLKNVKTVILDEADLMLGMGFKDEIERILLNTKARKQTVLFSATMHGDIIKLAQKHQKKAQHINVQKKQQDKKENIKQTYYKVSPNLKREAIKRLLCYHSVKSALIFCNTKRQVDKLCNNLKDEGFCVAKLHGDLRQNKRDAVMKDFREGETKILIATDIAARGIDVYDIGAVFNYNLPYDSEDYIHRIGRTGRAGKSGLALSLTDSKEIQYLKKIATKHKLNLNTEAMPTMESLDFSSITMLENSLREGTLNRKTSKRHLKLIKKISEKTSGDKDIINNYIENLGQEEAHIFGVGV